MLNTTRDSSFHSRQLADAMAKLGRRIATEYLDPTILESFLANRLIPLDKNPGTRPVGVGEVSRRAIGKAIMHVVKKDAMEARCSQSLRRARSWYSGSNSCDDTTL